MKWCTSITCREKNTQTENCRKLCNASVGCSGKALQWVLHGVPCLSPALGTTIATDTKSSEFSQVGPLMDGSINPIYKNSNETFFKLTLEA